MLLFGWLSLAAQGISVTSFKPLPNDLTANMAGTQVKDQNGEVAALIKVVTTQTGFSFEGGSAGIVKTRQEVGEVWVYVPHGIKKITIKHPQLGVLRDYYFPCAVEKATTYEMVLATGEVRTVVTQDAGGSFLAMSVEPKNASVYIDGELQPIDSNGELMTMLPYGEHQYRVEANGYMNEAGVLSIGKETLTKVVRLKSALATLTIKSTTPGADIIVNNQKRGTDSWTGHLTAGMYLIECQKPGHQSYKSSIQLAKQEEKVLTIPALSAKYASLVVSVKPIGADIYVDGTRIGATPGIFNDVLAMKHTVEVKKSGYKTLSSTIDFPEGEKQTLSGTLEKVQAASPAPSSSSPSGHQPASSGGYNGDMVFVQGGTFTMGDNNGVGTEVERPPHQVTLDSYYIGRTEVTQAQWAAVMGGKAQSDLGDNYPVRASLTSAKEFITRLNEMTGKHYRLPTEAEWEFAARGGNKTNNYTYSGSNLAGEVAWYNDTESHPVAQKKPNELGLYDMSGNLEEWTADIFGKYSSRAQVNPKGASSGNKYVVKGGGYWHTYDWAQRVSRRSDQEEGTTIFGFRLAMDAKGGGGGSLPTASATPSSRSNGNLKLFPVWGVDLGVSTASDLERAGYTVENRSDGNKYAKVNDFQCWDFNGDGRFETMYFTVYDKIPTEWRNAGFDPEMSYNDIMSFFKSNGFICEVLEAPHTSKYERRNTLSASVKFTSADSRYVIYITFDYGNDNGEGYSTSSRNSLYCVNIKAR